MNTQQHFDRLLRDCESATGFSPPELLHQYLVELLHSRLQSVDLIPDPSFAECYLRLWQRPSAQAFKHYADQCLFFTSLMPEYGHRRGLSVDYYAQLGQSSYTAASDLAQELCYKQLAEWFYPLQRFLNTAIHPDQRLELFGL